MKKLFDSLSDTFDKLAKDFEEIFESVSDEISDAIEANTEVVTVETETKPDGTVIRRTTTRRVIRVDKK